MKAVILAAGIGKRLRPLTETFAKAMVRVKGKPVLQKLIEDLRECGLKDLIIVIGHLGDQIKDFFGDGSHFGVRITYALQKDQLGTAHALLCAEPFLERNDLEFLLVFGDAWMEMQAIQNVLEKPSGIGVLSVVKVDDPRRFGVIEPDGPRIKSVVEKPVNPPSNLAVAGVFRLPIEIFNAIRSIPKSERGEYELPHAYCLLISQGVPFEWVDVGQWLDIGTKEDLEKANS